MVKRSIKTFALTAMLLASIGFAAADSADAKKGKFEYLPGDFHQHTYYTDGARPMLEVMRQNFNYGLAWWANSEHGGGRDRDGLGHKWTDLNYYSDGSPVEGDGAPGYMYRWQSLRDFVYPDIKITRDAYPDNTIISGLEWNVPGHEHCSTAINQYDDTATAISEFEFRFDRNDGDTSRIGETGQLGDLMSKTNTTKEDAILAVKWMQALKDAGLGDAWVVPAHVERAHSYWIEDFRNWMDAGPDVAIGFEGAPGHQTSSDRGFGRGSLGGGTYGGTGFYVAMVGGLWDGLLAEGRKFWHFASSDYHRHWGDGGSDFFMGEYQKNYTYINTNAKDKIKAVFDGNRSGNTWNVMGDLITELEFTAKSKGKTAMMGQTLKVKKGKAVTIKIKVLDPETPNFCPFDFNNPSLAQIGIEQPLNMPELDHIDVIAGTITGNVPTTNEADPAATDYETDAQVIQTFYREYGKDKKGYMTYVMKIYPKNDMFIRLRGTNLPAGVPYETDELGNPLADFEANDNIYNLMQYAEEGYQGLGFEKGITNKLLNLMLIDDLRISTTDKLDDVVEAYADLWFYSNPIFIKVK
jgi:hypothetical protein